MTRTGRSHLLRYGVAVTAVVLATLLRKMFDPVLGSAAPFSTYYVAIMFTAWYGGLGPSLAALIFGAVLADYYFVEPRGTLLSNNNLEQLVSLGLYFVVGIVVTLLSESLHASRRRTEAARDELANANRELQKEIEERRRAEQWLLESEQRFRGCFEQGLIGMTMLSADKDWIEVNHRLCQMLGYSEEELTKKTWTELTYPDDVLGEEAQFQRMLGGVVKGYVTDSRFVHKDGQIVYARLSAQCMRKDRGMLDCILVLVQEITERKRM
jgi:PAS domain S-box-containing protein